ncbi:MAG: hypothetical protein ACK40L_03810 [Hydrogenophaga sp.]
MKVLKEEAVPALRKSTAADYKRSFSTPLGKAAVGYVALMGLIALFIPSDVLTAYPGAATFSDFMASWVPQIDRLAALNIQPEVNRFYYAVLWAMSPGLLVLSVFKVLEDLRMGLGDGLTMPLVRLLPFVALFSVAIFASQFGYWMTDTGNSFLRFIVGNRLGRAFWGNIMFVTAPTFMVSALLAIAYGRLRGQPPSKAQARSEGNES